MQNIIREDCQFSPELNTFPAANANIAIFGTQSSGKSTLLNNIFGTQFPVLNTSITRQRCTKGVWLHNISKFNVIDTEGFDSEEREVHEKIFEKQVALFCLALADVLLINMWMDEIGRYEASHMHVIKAIIRASQRLISKQQRRIIFIVRDCTEDADRSILREQLNNQMQTLIKAQTKKSNMRFNLQYFMMSHYFDNQKAFKKEAKELFNLLTLTKKSSLSNYTDEDRIVYVRNLWNRVTTDNQIDLRTAQDALRNYALERVKRETLDFMENWIECVTSLDRHKTYLRYKEAAARQARIFFSQTKPKHLKDKDVQIYIEVILQAIDSKLNKHFMTVLLPFQEDRLIQEEYKRKVDLEMDSNVVYFKRNMERRKEEVIEIYEHIIKSLREHAKMRRRFIEKVEFANQKYVQYLEHMHTVFKIQLESTLNQEVDKMTEELKFDSNKLHKTIKIIEDKHRAEIGTIDLGDIWDRIVTRTATGTIVARIKAEGEKFSTNSLGAFMGNQTQMIVEHYQLLQGKAQKYMQNLISFMTPEEQQTAATLQKVQSIRRLIHNLIEQKVVDQTRRFKISLVFIIFLMYFFYSEFRSILGILGMSKKRRKRWMWLYTLSMLSMLGIVLYRKREYLKTYIEPV